MGAIASTLFIALLTSSLKKIDSINANIVTNWAIGLCIFCYYWLGFGHMENK